MQGSATGLQPLGTTAGLPLALSGDRFGVVVRHDPYWALAEDRQGHQYPTPFGAILQALAIAFIGAGSPQAKGRAERLRRTRQDRLVVELRLQVRVSVHRDHPLPGPG